MNILNVDRCMQFSILKAKYFNRVILTILIVSYSMMGAQALASFDGAKRSNYATPGAFESTDTSTANTDSGNDSGGNDSGGATSSNKLGPPNGLTIKVLD